ncbi:MAG: acetate--CoA ligase family protein [Methanomassiliicoccales archaeon]|nr:acetate--CoA ligase family protein [Methanomassiliicoccales archaeon]
MDLGSARKQGRKGLSESEVKSLLRSHGVKTTDFRTPRREELESLDVRFPVAVKVCSSDILHKTELGGVFLNVKNREEMIARFDEIRSKFPDASVLIEPMERPGIEVIIGLFKDPNFGLSIMFGMGGVLTELYKDVSFRLVPIGRMDADEMINEIKAEKVFRGFRGMKADRDSLLNLLVEISSMGNEFEDHINQLDLNPVFVRDADCVVVDAKLMLEPW